MYGLDWAKPRFLTACAFLVGLNASDQAGFLRGFEAWLDLREGQTSNVAFPGRILDEVLPQRAGARPADMDEQADQRAFDLLFGLLDAYFAECGEPGGHEGILRRQRQLERDERRLIEASLREAGRKEP